MYVGSAFPPFEDQAGRVLAFDLSALLDEDETITAVVSRLRTLSGVDALPATHLPVAPQFSGARVSQLVVFDDPAEALIGNRYALSISAATSAGRILMPWARFEVTRGFGLTGYAGGTPSAATRSLVLKVPGLYYTLTVMAGGYAGQDFPVANQGELLAYGLDFTPALSPGETISTAASFLSLLSGADQAVTDSPEAYDNASPATIAGPIVSQKLTWPGGSALVGNIYALYLRAVTSRGQSLAAWARIFVGPIA